MTPPPFIIKMAELVAVFEAEIGHPLGLLKVKAGNLRRVLMVVRVKLAKQGQKNLTVSTKFMLLTRNLADNLL